MGWFASLDNRTYSRLTVPTLTIGVRPGWTWDSRWTWIANVPVGLDVGLVVGGGDAVVAVAIGINVGPPPSLPAAFPPPWACTAAISATTAIAISAAPTGRAHRC